MGLFDKDDTDRILDNLENTSKINYNVKPIVETLKEKEGEKIWRIFFKNGESIDITAYKDGLDDTSMGGCLLVLADKDSKEVAVFNLNNIAGFKMVNSTTRDWCDWCEDDE